jgi:hypothetical protein
MGITAGERTARESLRINGEMIRPTWTQPAQESGMTFKAETAVNAEIRALAENEIDAVSGGDKGKPQPQPFVFVHLYDKSSPVLAK